MNDRTKCEYSSTVSQPMRSSSDGVTSVVCQSMCWLWLVTWHWLVRLPSSRRNALSWIVHACRWQSSDVRPPGGKAAGKFDPLPAAAEQCWNSFTWR